MKYSNSTVQPYARGMSVSLSSPHSAVAKPPSVTHGPLPDPGNPAYQTGRLLRAVVDNTIKSVKDLIISTNVNDRPAPPITDSQRRAAARHKVNKKSRSQNQKRQDHYGITLIKHIDAFDVNQEGESIDRIKQTLTEILLKKPEQFQSYVNRTNKILKSHRRPLIEPPYLVVSDQVFTMAQKKLAQSLDSSYDLTATQRDAYAITALYKLKNNYKDHAYYNSQYQLDQWFLGEYFATQGQCEPLSIMFKYSVAQSGSMFPETTQAPTVRKVIKRAVKWQKKQPLEKIKEAFQAPSVQLFIRSHPYFHDLFSTPCQEENITDLKEEVATTENTLLADIPPTKRDTYRQLQARLTHILLESPQTFQQCVDATNLALSRSDSELSSLLPPYITINNDLIVHATKIVDTARGQFILQYYQLLTSLDKDVSNYNLAEALWKLGTLLDSYSEFEITHKPLSIVLRHQAALYGHGHAAWWQQKQESQLIEAAYKNPVAKSFCTYHRLYYQKPLTGLTFEEGAYVSSPLGRQYLKPGYANSNRVFKTIKIKGEALDQDIISKNKILLIDTDKEQLVRISLPNQEPYFNLEKKDSLEYVEPKYSAYARNVLDISPVTTKQELALAMANHSLDELLEFRDSQGNTVLHQAVWSCNSDIVTYMIKNGLQELLEIQNNKGNKPLDLARAIYKNSGALHYQLNKNLVYLKQEGKENPFNSVGYFTDQINEIKRVLNLYQSYKDYFKENFKENFWFVAKTSILLLWNICAGPVIALSYCPFLHNIEGRYNPLRVEFTDETGIRQFWDQTAEFLGGLGNIKVSEKDYPRQLAYYRVNSITLEDADIDKIANIGQNNHYQFNETVVQQVFRVKQEALTRFLLPMHQEACRLQAQCFAQYRRHFKALKGYTTEQAKFNIYFNHVREEMVDALINIDMQKASDINEEFNQYCETLLEKVSSGVLHTDQKAMVLMEQSLLFNKVASDASHFNLAYDSLKTHLQRVYNSYNPGLSSEDAKHYVFTLSTLLMEYNRYNTGLLKRAVIPLKQLRENIINGVIEEGELQEIAALLKIRVAPLVDHMNSNMPVEYCGINMHERKDVLSRACQSHHGVVFNRTPTEAENTIHDHRVRIYKNIRNGMGNQDLPNDVVELIETKHYIFPWATRIIRPAGVSSLAPSGNSNTSFSTGSSFS